MVSAMAKHTYLRFLLSHDVFMYFIMFLYVLCFTWLQERFPLGDSNVEVEVEIPS